MQKLLPWPLASLAQGKGEKKAPTTPSSSIGWISAAEVARPDPGRTEEGLETPKQSATEAGLGKEISSQSSIWSI